MERIGTTPVNTLLTDLETNTAIIKDDKTRDLVIEVLSGKTVEEASTILGFSKVWGYKLLKTLINTPFSEDLKETAAAQQEIVDHLEKFCPFLSSAVRQHKRKPT